MNKKLERKVKEALKAVNPKISAKELEAKFKDSKLQDLLSILSVLKVKQIRCLKCEKVLVDLDKDGAVVGEHPTYLARRFRFDGEWGYQCACGNDSRVSEAEEEIMPAPRLIRPPTAKELEMIYENIKKNPPVVKRKKDGTVEVDGFAEEKI